MSMFYCEFHGCTEDSDVVGFNETDFGYRCDEGADALTPFDSEDEPSDGFLTDAEADADVLSSAGWGTDEDYGYFGDEG